MNMTKAEINKLVIARAAINAALDTIIGEEQLNLVGVALQKSPRRRVTVLGRHLANKFNANIKQTGYTDEYIAKSMDVKVVKVTKWVNGSIEMSRIEKDSFLTHTCMNEQTLNNLIEEGRGN